MANRTSSELLLATKEIATAQSDGEFDAAMARRAGLVRALGQVGPEDADDVRAAFALGEDVRGRLLRRIVENRAALERIRAMAPACHARSSVACAG